MSFAWIRALMAGMLLMAGGAVAAPVQAPGLAALDTLEQGEWELRVRGPGGAVKHLCLGDARALLQVQHGDRSCSRFVVTDTAQQVAVTYDCAAAGNGRSDLRIETPRLVQIQSQGISNGAPFAFAMEARRIGACH